MYRSLFVSDSAMSCAQDRLVDEGYNPAYGARPLRRAIMRLLEDSMAERMLAGDIKARTHPNPYPLCNLCVLDWCMSVPSCACWRTAWPSACWPATSRRAPASLLVVL